jgi:hypothetical protein
MQASKRVKLEKVESTKDESRIPLVDAPPHDCLTLGTLKIPCVFLEWALRNLRIPITDPFRQSVAERWKDKASLTPEGNRLFFVEQLSQWWPGIDMELRTLTRIGCCFRALLMGSSIVTVDTLASLLPQASPRAASDMEMKSTPQDCPLSGQPVRIAVRHRQCTHWRCFDLASFIQHLQCTTELVSQAEPVAPTTTTTMTVANKQVKCPVCPRHLFGFINLERDLEFERQVRLVGENKKVKPEAIALD